MRISASALFRTTAYDFPREASLLRATARLPHPSGLLSNLVSALPSTADIHRGDGYVSFVPTTDSCTAATRSCFRLRFRGDGRRQRAMIGTSSPAKRRMSGRTVADLLTNLALDPFGKIPDKFCAVRAKLVGIRTAAEQATAGINPPDRC